MFTLPVIDFGLVVLIWIVQLVVYPSFHYYDVAGLKRWHRVYTRQVTFIVLPLMLAQVILHAKRLLDEPYWLGTVQFILIVLVWGITFFKAVPLHTKIDLEDQPAGTITDLVRWNWPRTILWSIVFVIHFF